MGQAKKRGTASERIEAAKTRNDALYERYGVKETNIDEVRRDIGLGDSGVVVRGLSSTPMNAMIFSTVDSAVDAAKTFKYPVDVCLFFEDDKQVYVQPLLSPNETI
jgi:hypothetical protein